MTYIQDIKITAFDKKRWVVETSIGHHLLVNESSKALLELLQVSSSKEDALESFNHQFSQNLDLLQFELLLNEKFGDLNLLEESGKETKKKSYMSLKLPLIPSRIAGLLAQPFVPLFHPIVFWVLFPSVLIFTILMGVREFTFEDSWISANNLLMFTLLMYLTMLIHELGHIAACRKFKIRHGEIGFGFYSIFPVLYADVSNIWTTNKHQRTIANLGGIYLEVIYAAVLCICYLSTAMPVYLIAAVSILFKTITQLNPFIRFDGYWVVSDLTNTPNLLPKANAMVRNIASLFRRPVSEKRWKLSHYLLTVYGLANWAILGLYVGWMINRFWDEILVFPATLVQSLIALFSQNYEPIMDMIRFENLLIFGLYTLIIKLMVNWLLKIFKKTDLLPTSV